MIIHSVSGAYVSFVIAAGLLVMTPGLDTALVLRTVAAAGVKRAAFVAIGTCCGVMIWGGVVAAGLGAVLNVSQHFYAMLRWAGTAYLLYVGGQLLFSPRRAFVIAPMNNKCVNTHDNRHDNTYANGPKPQSPAVESFLRGLLSNVLNPKIGVFYVTFLPQFVPAHVNATRFILSLAGIQVIEAAIWFSLLLALTRPIRQWLSRPAVVTSLDRLTGLVLIGFGARLATSD